MINAASDMTVSVASSRDKPGGGLVNATVARGPDQAGALTLRLDGGREVGVQIVGDGPKLTAGQNVLFNQAEGKIYLPDAAQTQQAQQQPSSSQAQTPALTGESAQTPQSAQTQQSAQSQLSSQAQLAAQTQPSGQTAPGGAAAVSGGQVGQLKDKLESPLLRSIPASVWEQIIGERGGKIDAEALKALDSALRNRSIPIDPSSPIQMERIGQWLRTVLDNPHLAEELAERVPVSGGKDIAGLMELIGKANAGLLPKDAAAGISPERFFITMDKMLGAGLSADKLLALGIDRSLIAALTGGVNANSGGAMLEILLKSTFSSAPNALLDMMKQINVSAAAAGSAPLPSAEAQRIVNNIINNLPAQAIMKPEVLHDARQISPQNLTTEVQAPQRAPVQGSVIPQIRSEYSALTESAIQLLLGGDNKKAGAEISERIGALGRLVERIPVADGRVDGGQNVSSVGGRGSVVDRPFVADKPSVAADRTFVADKPVGAETAGDRGRTPLQGVERGITVDRPAGVERGITIDRQAGVDRAVIVDKPPILTNDNKTAADIRSSVLTNDIRTAVDGKPQVSASEIKTAADGKFPASTNEVRTAADVKSPVSTNEIRAAVPTDNRMHTAPIDRPAVINTPAAAKSSVIDRPQTSIPPVRADNIAKPVDIQTIKNDSMRIIDNLKSAAEPVLRSIERNSGIDTGEKTRLLGAVRDAISTLDNTLRPLAREGRPVPPEFYERVTSSPKHQITAETKNEVFVRINTAQDLIRNTIDTVQSKSIPVDRGVSNITNILTSQLSTDKSIQNAANPSTQPQQQLSGDKPVSTPNAINTSTQSQQQQLSGDKSVSTPNAVNPSTQQQQQLSGDKPVSTPNAINTSTQQPQQLSGDKSAPTPNTVNTSAQSQPQQLPPDKPTPNTFLQMAERMWADTEKIRAGFREAFSSLDLPNRASPLEPAASDKSTPHVIRQSIDALRTEILLDVSRALREVFSSVEDLRNIVTQLSDKLKMLPEAEAALLRAVRDLEHQAHRSGAEVNDRLKDILRELNRLQSDATKAREPGADSMPRPSPADAVRSAIMGAARGLENLQLLASQTRGTELQQQVLALPVKIGEEWNEVHIKFVKDRKDGGEKKKSGGHVSIYINVAPSKLGSVTAHLDFYPPSSLKLSLGFEKPEVTNWFRERYGELRGALAEAGLPGTALEFHTSRAAAAPAVKKDVSAAKPAETETKTGVIGLDGKVDFKV
ncbi:MAG: hypothetical protein FWC23_07165 [Chitinispirillia bacterium]|nr:hypothetical protein [Chitinispirillia bacterium]MCL2268948.1 hypothetical protein [Chitinispirillia bacterium]